MRRKSTRNAAKVSPDKFKEEKSPKKTRRHSKRHKGTSSESASDDEASVANVDNGSNQTVPEMWTVTQTEQSNSDIGKIKICLARPSPATPERVSKRLRNKSFTNIEDSPPAIEEKPTRRSRRRGGASPMTKEEQPPVQQPQEVEHVEEKKGKGKSKGKHKSKIVEQTAHDSNEMPSEISENVQVTAQSPQNVDLTDTDATIVDCDLNQFEDENSVTKRADLEVQQPEIVDSQSTTDSVALDPCDQSNENNDISNNNNANEHDNPPSLDTSQIVQEQGEDSVKDEACNITVESAVQVLPEESAPVEEVKETKAEEVASVVTDVAMDSVVESSDPPVTKTETLEESVTDAMESDEKSEVDGKTAKVDASPIKDELQESNENISEDKCERVIPEVVSQEKDNQICIEDEDVEMADQENGKNTVEESIASIEPPTKSEETTPCVEPMESETITPKESTTSEETIPETEPAVVHSPIVEEIPEKPAPVVISPEKPKPKPENEMKPEESNHKAELVEKIIEKPVVEVAVETDKCETLEVKTDECVLEEASAKEEPSIQLADVKENDATPNLESAKNGEESVNNKSADSDDKKRPSQCESKPRIRRKPKSWGDSVHVLDLLQVTSLKLVDMYPSLTLLDENNVRLGNAQRDRQKEKIQRQQSADKRRVSLDDATDKVTPTSATEEATNGIALNRKISIVEDEASSLKPPPSPAKNDKSSVLFITNLVRPFTVKQLRGLLERTGKIVEDGFWTDKIKSKCFVEYETEEEAETTRNALHGVLWPIGNGKKLIIDYSTQIELENAKNPPVVAPVPPPVEASKENQEPQVKKANYEATVEEPEEKKVPAWSEKDTRLKRTDSWDEQDLKRTHPKSTRSPSPAEEPRKRSKREEPAQQRAMDDLFRRTEATPSIYWQPLSPEEISLKQQQRQQRMEAHKRKMETQARPRRNSDRVRGGGGPYRRRY